MAARPTWQGHLRLSLVTCPVALYTATSRASDVSFNLINPKTNNRIRMVTTDPDTGPVERSSLVKGYEVEKNRYVILTDEDIESVRLDSSKIIEIDRFVDAADIDRLYWNDPYYLVPSGDIAAEAFGVIREAMVETSRVALGRVVMHTRERMLALEPRDKGIVAWTLRTKGEVRKTAEYFDDIPDSKLDKGMLSIAEKIIEQQEGPFDPSTFNDRYEEALKSLIAAKEKGQKPVTAEAPKDTKVNDLMEALRASLQRGASPSPPRKAAAKSAAPRKAAAEHKTARRPTARRKAG